MLRECRRAYGRAYPRAALLRELALAGAATLPERDQADLPVARPADLLRQAATRSYRVLAGLAPGRCLADELIAERREDARREDAAEDSAAHPA
jgi:hypothetical protein